MDAAQNSGLAFLFHRVALACFFSRDCFSCSAKRSARRRFGSFGSRFNRRFACSTARTGSDFALISSGSMSR